MNKVAKDPARGKQAPDTAGQRATKPVQSTLYEINNLKENLRRPTKFVQFQMFSHHFLIF